MSRNTDLRFAQHWNVVLSVTESNQVALGSSQLFERAANPHGFIDSAWKHHQGRAIENQLSVKTESTNQFQKLLSMLLPGADNDCPGVKRYALSSQLAEKMFWGRIADLNYATMATEIYNRAVLGHYRIE